MNKKFFLITAVIVFVAACAFFAPRTIRQFTGKEEYDRVLVVIEKPEHPYGVPTIEKEAYEIKSEKGVEVLDSLFGIFEYCNALDTVFSDSMGIESRLIDIFLYQGEYVVHTIQVSDTGHVLLDGRLYEMRCRDYESDFMDLLVRVLNDHAEETVIQ